MKQLMAEVRFMKHVCGMEDTAGMYASKSRVCVVVINEFGQCRSLAKLCTAWVAYLTNLKQCTRLQVKMP